MKYDIKKMTIVQFLKNYLVLFGEEVIESLQILASILVVIIISVFNNKTEYSTRVVFAIFFSISIGRLMFSSVLWERPEFWMLICLYLTSGLQSNNKLLHFR